MELKQRFEILTQGAQIAQKAGALSLDDAVVVKTAIDNINSNVNIEASADVLIKVAEMGQKAGAYTLKDAYLIFAAIDDLPETIKASKMIDKLTEDENETPTEEVKETPAQ
jgi:hypothetical protein